MTPPWWAAFGPAEAEVSCGAGKHRLRWADGTLQAADHPDAEGELVLAALGGEASPCLELVRTWGQHSDDLTVLAVGPRSPADKLTVIPVMAAELTTGWHGSTPLVRGRGRPKAMAVARYVSRNRPASTFSSFTTFRHHVRPAPRRAAMPMVRSWSGMGGWPGREDDPARTELIRLLALGAPFQWRLSGAVAHAWSGDGEHAGRQDGQRPALTAALAGRLGPAAAQWLGINPADVDASIHTGPGWGQLSLSRSAAKPRLVASLSVGWLAAAWAPGLAVVGGHLVVSVLHASWPDVRVLAIRSPDRDPVELSIRYDREHWKVASR